MAAVTRVDTTTPVTTNQATYASASFTPTAGDLLVVEVAASATATDPATLTASANGLTFTQVASRNDPAISAGVGLWLFVANEPVPASPSAMTVTVDFGGDPASGCHIVVSAVSGMTRTGTAAVRQWGGSTNGAGGTPAVTLAAACLTTNAVIAFAINLTNSTTTLTPPASFVERYDAGYATPTTGCEVASRDSAHTSATVTAGSTMSAGLYVVAELDVTPALPILVQPPRRP